MVKSCNNHYVMCSFQATKGLRAMPIRSWTDWRDQIDVLLQRWRQDAHTKHVSAGEPGRVRHSSDTPASWPSLVELVDALPNALVLLDHRLVVLHGNEWAREALGEVRTGEHISRSSRHPELTQALSRIQDGEQRASFEMQVRGPIERHLYGSATRLASQGQREQELGTAGLTILLVLQDISERDALARMRMEFVANASHELRTPLASLSGFIETLQGPAKDDRQARERFLGIMAEQAARMRRLIDDLLLLSRVEMRAHVTPTERADVNAVVAEAIKPLIRQAEMIGAQLQVVAAHTAPLVRGDHDELVQAVQNLVQNALKYGNPKGTVTVRVLTPDDGKAAAPSVVISVTDDGPGIAPEHLPRLTERFYRVSTAASREKGGTGLGLAIVKHIVTRHQGRLEITSEVGKGSTFAIHLSQYQL
jgi:two-component system, OmpR family, phosphate regulon sensor histidine kinase PhoR